MQFLWRFFFLDFRPTKGGDKGRQFYPEDALGNLMNLVQLMR